MTALSLHQLDSRQHTLYVESSLRIGAVYLDVTVVYEVENEVHLLA